MKHGVSVTIRQLFLYLYCASKFTAPRDEGVFSGEALHEVPNDKLCARLWLVGYIVLLS